MVVLEKRETEKLGHRWVHVGLCALVYIEG